MSHVQIFLLHSCCQKIVNPGHECTLPHACSHQKMYNTFNYNSTFCEYSMAFIIQVKTYWLTTNYLLSDVTCKSPQLNFPTSDLSQTWNVGVHLLLKRWKDQTIQIWRKLVNHNRHYKKAITYNSKMINDHLNMNC